MKKMCKINELSHNAGDTVKDEAFRLALQEVFQEWQDSEHGSETADHYLELLDDKDLKTLREHSFWNKKINALIYHVLVFYNQEEDGEFITPKELLEIFQAVRDEHDEHVYPYWKTRLFNMFCGIHDNS